jgi:cation-transporting ATPase 13A1
MMASSWLVMTASLAFSYSTPIEKMHPVRPLRSLFHPAISISILGQAAIHLFCMVQAVNLAKEYMGPDLLAEVNRFNRRAARGLDKQLAAAEQDPDADSLDAMADFFMMWQAPFMPNLLNTVIFLVETSQIMAVLFVNYKGRPWMLGVVENHALFLSLFMCIGALIFCAWEFSPSINRLIHLEPFPDDEFSWKIIGSVSGTLFGTFLWDRLVTALFAKHVFAAMLEQAYTTRLKDFLPVLANLGKAVAFFALLATGNPLFWIGGWYARKRYNAWVEAQELASISQ